MPPRNGTTGMFGKSIHTVVAETTAPAFKKRGVVHTKLLTEWAHIAGPALSALATPTEVKFPKGKNLDGTLVLEVTSSNATVVQHQEGLLLEKIAIYLAYRAIARIQLKHCAPAQTTKPPATKPPRAEHTPLPAALKELPEGELKEALERLGKTLLTS